jgi:ATP-binding protein involved in chromosome partitioning
MNITKDQVLRALSHVHDPDLKKDLVTLQMIDDISIEGSKIRFKLVLTTPACPLKGMLQMECIKAVHKYVDKDAEVEVELTSRVTSKRKVTEEMLAGVKNIIAVASGKGGVGKSTVAANLAVALGATGATVGLIDADIYGPSIPMMFDLVDEHPLVTEVKGKPKITPIVKYGIHILSIGFFVDPTQALIWRGPMASNALIQLFNDAIWGELDYMIIDLPPGTGDIHLTLVQQVPVTGVAIVTTPQEVAMADARKAVNMFRQEKINVPVLGLIENMSFFTPPELPQNRYYIFGREGGRQLAKETHAPLLGEIPIVESICESGDTGIPAALQIDTPVGKAFAELAGHVAQQVAIRNALLEPTRVVAVNKPGQ